MTEEATYAVPSATYRLQITAEFTLFDAAAVTGYLAELGVGAVYVSPLLRSTTGSSHGYDVVDHRLVDPDRGGDAGLAALAEPAARPVWAWSSTSCPTTWVWPFRPRTTPGGTCCDWARSRRSPAGSTSTGRSTTAGS